MQFVPYLNFDGNCAEAFAFYAELFKGTIVYQGRFGEMPPQPGMPPLTDASKNRIFHVHLQVGQQSLMASDTLPATPGQDFETCAGGYKKPQGQWISICVDDPAEGQRVFDALAQGGVVMKAFGKTFWSEGFGVVTDRFGTPWMVDVAQKS